MNLLIGKNGFIATHLASRGEYKTTSSVVDSDSIFLDLKNPENFDYSSLNKDVTIIFLAAISSPDICNYHYEEAYKINVIGTKFFISQAIRRGARVLFFSSDVVYGNTFNPVNENSANNAFGRYASMKDEIEKAFLNEKNFKVFRLSYVLSKEDKYLSYLNSCFKKKEVAEVFHPFVRKVVYLDDVLLAIERIIQKWNEFSNQKFNICGIENISRKDIADFYNENMGNKLIYDLIEPNEKFWEARPKDINITSLYLEKLLGRKPIRIQEAVRRILEGVK